MFSELIASLIVAIVQGFSEWLPISSSGHLVLIERILDFNGGFKFDVALHFGTLMAVFVYFGEDIIEIVRAVFSGNWKSEKAKLGFFVIIATIPAALVGFFLLRVFELAFSSLTVVAMGLAITGVVLLIASTSKERKNSKVGLKESVLTGLAQMFALFPGISRSGTTISSGFLLGLKEKEAIKFSFLMSIPAIFGANILVIGNEPLSPNLLLPTLVSFVVGLITIYLLYDRQLVSRKNMKWFGLYTLLLALVLGLWLIFA